MTESWRDQLHVEGTPLWRQRLSSLAFSEQDPTVICAPPGFGVSTIAAHLGSDVHHTPAVILDLEAVDPEQLRLDRLLEDHVVFVSRGTQELRHIPHTRLIDHSILRFTEDEAIEVAAMHGIHPTVARAIHLFTAGWPAYFMSCVDATDPTINAEDAYDQLHKGPHLDHLVSACTAGLDPADLSQIAQLTHFARISPGLIDALLGPDGLPRVQRAGLPIVETHPGWYEILEPVRSVLRSDSSLDEQTARKIAPELIADAGLVAGARILLAAGQASAAAAALRSVPIYELDEGSQPALLSLLRTVLDSEKDDGSLRLRLARVHHNHGDLVSFRSTLEDAASAASEQLRPDLEVEANAELLLLDVEGADYSEVVERHKSLQARARQHGNPLALIRLREVEVMLHIESDQLDRVYTGVSKMESIADDWELVGEHSRAAASLRMLASRGLTHLGMYAKGVEVLERACELSKRQPQGYLKTVVLLARFYAQLGDVEGFTPVSAHASELLSSSGLPWIEAFHTWSQMVVAGFEQNPDAVGSLHRRAESLMVKELFDHPTGAVFTAEAAVAFANAGNHEQAKVVLAKAVDRRTESPLEVAVAEVLVHALAGEPQCGPLLTELLESEIVPVERRWRLELAVGIALGRPDSGTLQNEAERGGLMPLYQATVECATPRATTRPLRLQLLGQFAVFDRDQPKNLSGGKATELIKFLGVRSKAIPVDVVIEHLWGDVSTDLGLRRLKNVVNRARAALGQDAVERRGQTIGLGAHVTSDLIEINTLIRLLRTKTDVELATQIVDLYRGPLLELDVYDDWIQSQRRAVTVAVGSALTLAVESGTVDAAWAMDALLRLQPLEDALYMSVAHLAAQQDDAITLRIALCAVRRACADLHVDLPRGFSQLEALAPPGSDRALEGA